MHSTDPVPAKHREDDQRDFLDWRSRHQREAGPDPEELPEDIFTNGDYERERWPERDQGLRRVAAQANRVEDMSPLAGPRFPPLNATKPDAQGNFEFEIPADDPWHPDNLEDPIDPVLDTQQHLHRARQRFQGARDEYHVAYKRHIDALHARIEEFRQAAGESAEITHHYRTVLDEISEMPAIVATFKAAPAARRAKMSGPLIDDDNDA